MLLAVADGEVLDMNVFLGIGNISGINNPVRVVHIDDRGQNVDVGYLLVVQRCGKVTDDVQLSFHDLFLLVVVPSQRGVQVVVGCFPKEVQVNRHVVFVKLGNAQVVAYRVAGG